MPEGKGPVKKRSSVDEDREKAWRRVQAVFADLTTTEAVQMCSLMQDHLRKKLREAEDQIARDKAMDRVPEMRWIVMYTKFQERVNALHEYATHLSAEEFARDLIASGFRFSGKKP